MSDTLVATLIPFGNRQRHISTVTAPLGGWNALNKYSSFPRLEKKRNRWEEGHSTEWAINAILHPVNRKRMN